MNMLSSSTITLPETVKQAMTEQGYCYFRGRDVLISANLRLAADAFRSRSMICRLIPIDLMARGGVATAC